MYLYLIICSLCGVASAFLDIIQGCIIIDDSNLKIKISNIETENSIIETENKKVEPLLHNNNSNNLQQQKRKRPKFSLLYSVGWKIVTSKM